MCATDPSPAVHHLQGPALTFPPTAVGKQGAEHEWPRALALSSVADTLVIVGTTSIPEGTQMARRLSHGTPYCTGPAGGTRHGPRPPQPPPAAHLVSGMGLPSSGSGVTTGLGACRAASSPSTGVICTVAHTSAVSGAP